MNQYAFLACNILRALPLSPPPPPPPVPPLLPCISLIFPSRFSLFYAREQLTERQECERNARLANTEPTQRVQHTRRWLSPSSQPLSLYTRLRYREDNGYRYIPAAGLLPGRLPSRAALSAALTATRNSRVGAWCIARTVTFSRGNTPCE